MKIVVCIKQIAQTYCRSGFDPETHFLAPEDTFYRLNPFDEAALELALGVKASHEKTSVILLTLGPIQAEAELRRCLALGADQLIQINQEGLMDPWQKSIYLARAIQDLEPLVILCGKESLDTQNGQIGAFLAHHLKRPFVSAITRLTLSSDIQSGTVQSSGGRGIRETILCPLPGVFSVDIIASDHLFPTYPDHQKSWIEPIPQINYTDLKPEPKTRRAEVFVPRPRPKRVPAPDGSRPAFERIEQLLMATRIRKSGTLLTGELPSLVDGILSFLEDNGFSGVKKNT